MKTHTGIVLYACIRTYVCLSCCFRRLGGWAPSCPCPSCWRCRHVGSGTLSPPAVGSLESGVRVLGGKLIGPSRAARCRGMPWGPSCSFSLSRVSASGGCEAQAPGAAGPCRGRGRGCAWLLASRSSRSAWRCFAVPFRIQACGDVTVGYTCGRPGTWGASPEARLHQRAPAALPSSASGGVSAAG